MSSVDQVSQDYAVLFVGSGNKASNYTRYYASLRSLYDVLTNERGVDPGNVFILYADGDTGLPNQNLDYTLSPLSNSDEPIVQLDYLDSLFDRAGLTRQEVVTLLAAPGVYEPKHAQRVVAALQSIRQKFKDTNTPVEVDITQRWGDDGNKILEVNTYVPSDFDFAQGSRILPGTPDALREIFLSSQSPLANLTANDHLFFWTFDHGGFADGKLLEDYSNFGDLWVQKDGSPITPSLYFSQPDIPRWGNPAAGNLANLTGWGGNIDNQDLVTWIAPAVDQAGFSTLVYNQCFSGGMLEASRELLASADHAYGMAAANPYETSKGFAFPEAIKQALAQGNPTAYELFGQAKMNDIRAVSDPYPSNGGQGRDEEREHPWAYGGSGGDFKVFSDAAFESTNLFSIPLDNSGSLATSYSGQDLVVDLNEDETFDLRSALLSQLGQSTEITAISSPSSGLLERANGLIYTPTYDFHGIDTLFIEYKVAGGISTSVAKVNLRVASLNDAPVAVDDEIVLKDGERSVIISLDDQPGFLDDYDNDFDTLRIANYSSPENGRLKKTGPNSFKYIADKDFKGDDSFLYVITDGELYSTAEVRVSVGAGNFSTDAIYGTYELVSDGADPVINPLRRADGSLITDDDSSRWNVIAAERDGNKYKLLLEGLGRREGFFRVWDASLDGDLLKKRGWLSADAMNDKGYDDLFSRDFVALNPL